MNQSHLLRKRPWAQPSSPPCSSTISCSAGRTRTHKWAIFKPFRPQKLPFWRSHQRKTIQRISESRKEIGRKLLNGKTSSMNARALMPNIVQTSRMTLTQIATSAFVAMAQSSLSTIRNKNSAVFLCLQRKLNKPERLIWGFAEKVVQWNKTSETKTKYSKFKSNKNSKTISKMLAKSS